MKRVSTTPRPDREAPPPIAGAAPTSSNQFSGERTDGTPPEDWPLFADWYVPVFAKHPAVQQLLGYSLHEFVVKYGDPPPNPRFRVFMHQHYTILWPLVFWDLTSHPAPAPSHNSWSWPRELNAEPANEWLQRHQGLEPEACFDLVQLPDGGWVLYSRAMARFLLEHCLDGWHSLVEAFNAYYMGQIRSIALGQEADLLQVEQAFVRALRDTHPLERLQYLLSDQAGRDPQDLLGPDWQLDVLERFKGYLWRAFGQPTADFGGLDDRRFAKAFEAWWSRTLCFPDHGYGFAVIPAFSCADMARYAALPSPYRRNRIVWEMVDWVVFQLCPSLAVTVHRLDAGSTQQWTDLLVALATPLAQGLARRLARASQASDDEMSMLAHTIVQEVVGLATQQYHHWYHRLTAIKRGAIPAFLPTGFLCASRLQQKNDPELRHNPWIRWVRPSHFIIHTLQRKYTLRPPKNPQDDDQASERMPDECNADDDADELTSRRPSRSAWHQHRWHRSLSPHEERAIREELAQAAQARVADLRDVVELEGKRYLTVRGLARRVNCCEQTLRNHERRSHLEFVWQVPPGGKKPIRLFPDDDRAIEAVRWLCGREFKDQTIAQALGISDRQLRNRKRALKDAGLSRAEQKQHLICLIKARRGLS